MIFLCTSDKGVLSLFSRMKSHLMFNLGSYNLAFRCFSSQIIDSIKIKYEVLLIKGAN